MGRNDHLLWSTVCSTRSSAFKLSLSMKLMFHLNPSRFAVTTCHTVMASSWAHIYWKKRVWRVAPSAQMKTLHPSIWSYELDRFGEQMLYTRSATTLSTKYVRVSNISNARSTHRAPLAASRTLTMDNLNVSWWRTTYIAAESFLPHVYSSTCLLRGNYWKNVGKVFLLVGAIQRSATWYQYIKGLP